MRLRLLPIAAAVLALAFASGGAHAQTRAKRDAAVVPVLNKDSGKLEAVLLLEPATTGTGTGAGARWRFGSTTLEATYGVQAGDSLALVCDRQNGIASAIQNSFGIETWISGIVLTVVTGLVVLGGIKRIGAVAEKVVPTMAIIYLVSVVIVLVIFAENIPSAFTTIVSDAFTGTAAAGGFLGSTIIMAIQRGVARGIFSNEAGLGTGSIAHACADTKKPVKQGVFGIFEVFADTIVICTLTALVILCSGTSVNYGQAAGAELTISGFTLTYGGWASLFTAVALCCFAFSTIIGWGLYGSRCIEYLFHTDKVVRPFLVVYSFVAILGATMDLGLLWSIADTFNGLMSIPNLIALLLLSGTVAKLVKEFFAKEPQ